MLEEYHFQTNCIKIYISNQLTKAKYATASKYRAILEKDCTLYGRASNKCSSQSPKRDSFRILIDPKAHKVWLVMSVSPVSLPPRKTHTIDNGLSSILTLVSPKGDRDKKKELGALHFF